jgi:hypothetical protein
MTSMTQLSSAPLLIWEKVSSTLALPKASKPKNNGYIFRASTAKRVKAISQPTDPSRGIRAAARAVP